MKPRNKFLEDLQRAREARRPTPESKPISEMSEEELDREAERLRAELRRNKEQVVEAGREEVGGRRIFPRRTRRPWK